MSGTPDCCPEHVTQRLCPVRPPGLPPWSVLRGGVVVGLLVERCAGVDIGKAGLKACVRTPGAKGRRRQQIRTYDTTTNALLQLREWLIEERVTVVAMEATGDYWKPVYYLLEDEFEVQLLNAAHMHNVPGRKTDVSDAAWIAQLVEHGLIRASFVPPPHIRRLRDLTRYRSALVAERTREKQRVAKTIEDAGIKLSVFVSDIFGVSGRKMLAALIAGERDPQVLADHARGRMRPKRGVLVEALTGRFGEHHAFLCAMMLDHIDSLTVAIDTVTTQIGVDMSRFPTAANLASWAGMCPGNNESAGKHFSGRTRKGDSWLRAALGEAAAAGVGAKNTYLQSLYRRLMARRGKKPALVAVGHNILT